MNSYSPSEREGNVTFMMLSESLPIENESRKVGGGGRGHARAAQRAKIKHRSEKAFVSLLSAMMARKLCNLCVNLGIICVCKFLLMSKVFSHAQVAADNCNIFEAEAVGRSSRVMSR
jgi:hypothetical protein